MNTVKISPFKRGVPSLFFINSPFQAICMLEAIKEFEITDYQVYLVLYNDIRNEQLFALLEKEAVKYEVIDGNQIRLNSYFGLLYTFNSNRYKRAFIGHYNSDSFFYLALKKLSNNSDIVYLDDGAATITLLKGLFKRTGLGSLVFLYFKVIAKLHNISLENLYTIYGKLPNEKFNIYECDLSYLKSQSRNKTHKDIYFIGTNTSIYCNSYKIPEETLYTKLEQLLISLKRKYPNEHIIYVPHGRDESQIPKHVCLENDIEFKKVDTTVELYIASQNTQPLAIYGFSSSALFNLIKMMPVSLVYNVILTSSYHITDERLKGMMEYYEDNGIKTIEI